MTEPEDGVRIPPTFYEPLPPPKPRNHAPWLIALAVVAGALTVLGIVGTGIAVWFGTREVQAEKKREAAAAQALRDVVQRPADTETISPAPDGSRRWTSAGPDASSHTYRVTLPKGWEARRAAIQLTDVDWTDSVFHRAGTGTDLLVARVDLGKRLADRGVERELRAALSDDRTRIVSALTATRLGEKEEAYYFDAESVDDSGDRYLVRVLFFERFDEQFRLDLTAAPEEWDKMLRELEKILASWRWA